MIHTDIATRAWRIVITLAPLVALALVLVAGRRW